MATNPGYFKSLENKTVSMTDVIDAINAYVNSYIKGTITVNGKPVTNGGTGTVWSGQSTGISWGGTVYDLITKNINVLTEKFKSDNKNKQISADNLYNLIMESLWYACRVYWQYYRYYINVGYTNIRGYRAPIYESEHYRGLASSTHVTKDVFYSENSSKRPSSMHSDITITASDIDNFVTKLVTYNESKEYTTGDNNPKNTCYTSCHSECHGSSRGRR